MTALTARATTRVSSQAVVGGAAATAAGLTIVAIGVLAPGANVLTAMVIGGGSIATAWLFASRRYGLSLAILAVYLGVFDGYIKLKLNTTWATLGRDVLLYAVILGVLVRAAISARRFDVPPWTGWLVAWVGVVLVQLFNPANDNVLQAAGGVRPHLEFVPLFFFGYVLLRDTRSLRIFLVLLLVLAAVNGAVGFWQYHLTPAELADWGPGYEERVFGTGNFEGGARNFADDSGESRTRPFGLGPDTGFQAALAYLAIPGGLALFALTRRTVYRAGIAGLLGLAVVGIVTSQTRSAIVGAIVAVLAFLMLGLTARRRVALLATLLVAAAGSALLVSALGDSDENAFDRYSTLAPSKIIDTSLEERGATLTVIPLYVEAFPTGGGLGRSGPAAILAGGGQTYNSESEFAYLIVETGVLGLALILAFTLTVLWRTGRLRRVGDHDARLLLAAIAAPLCALFALWTIAPVTSNTPGSPYLWFVSGAFAWWVVRRPALQRSRLTTP